MIDHRTLVSPLQLGRLTTTLWYGRSKWDDGLTQCGVDYRVAVMHSHIADMDVFLCLVEHYNVKFSTFYCCTMLQTYQIPILTFMNALIAGELLSTPLIAIVHCTRAI